MVLSDSPDKWNKLFRPVDVHPVILPKIPNILFLFNISGELERSDDQDKQEAAPKSR